MSRPARSRAMRNIGSNLGSAAKFTGRTTEKAAVGLARWATTDHSGFGDALTRMPKMGFMDSIKYIFVQFLIAIFCAVIGGVLVFVLIAFGIPFLISVIFQ